MRIADCWRTASTSTSRRTTTRTRRRSPARPSSATSSTWITTGPKSDIKTLKRPLNSSSKYVCKKLASIDAGEAKFTINFKKAAFAAWLTLVSSGARKWLIIVLPDGPDETTTGGSMLLLRGFASGPGLSAGGSGEEVTSPCMFTVTCEPVFIPGEDEE
jgi:hypothetical protein